MTGKLSTDACSTDLGRQGGGIMTAAQILTMVEASRRGQGLPERVVDLAALATVARLLKDSEACAVGSET